MTKRSKYEFPYASVYREETVIAYHWNGKQWIKVERDKRWRPLREVLTGLHDVSLVNAGLAIAESFGFDLSAIILRNPTNRDRR